MNKRIISALVLAGMIASSSAFASDARELVMGTGGADSYSNGGSFYYEDAYNFFYNPSYVNDYKNWAIFEKGTGDDASSFGFVTSMMNWNFGAFFNRNAALATGDNAVDVMFGGDMGVKWGLGLTYGSKDSAAVADSKSSDLKIRIGAQMSGLDPFANFRIMSEDKVAGVTGNKYSQWGAGARYHFGEWVPYAAFQKTETKDDATDVSSAKTENLIVGLGRESKMAESARLMYSLYWVSDISTGIDSLPIDVAVEADVLSWLTLRGGVHHLIASDSGKATTVRAGGAFHMGKVDVEYAFGNEDSAGAVSPDSENVGFDSGTFHKVALRYSW